MPIGIGASLGLSALGGLASAGAGWLGSQAMGDTAKKYRKRANESGEAYSENLADYSESVEGLKGRGEGILDKYEGMSPQNFYSEFFDEQAEEVTRGISGQTAIASNAISRGVTASGGDVTGQAQSAMKSLQESANTSINRAVSSVRDKQFQAGIGEKRFQTGRGDRYILQAMQGQGNLAQITGQDARQDEMLAIQAEQAKRQSGFDIANIGMQAVGMGLNFVGQQSIANSVLKK